MDHSHNKIFLLELDKGHAGLHLWLLVDIRKPHNFKIHYYSIVLIALRLFLVFSAIDNKFLIHREQMRISVDILPLNSFDAEDGRLQITSAEPKIMRKSIAFILICSFFDNLSFKC